MEETTILPSGVSAGRPMIPTKPITEEFSGEPPDLLQFIAPTQLQTLAEVEKTYMLKALNVFEGNKTKAASALGITVKTLYNKLHEYGEFENFAVNKKTEKTEKVTKPTTKQTSVLDDLLK